MEAIADKVIGLLGSLAAKELELLCNFQDDLETMNKKVTGIRALLRDAEKKATKTEAVNDWLQKLKDMLLDVEDLLDANAAEELTGEVMTKDKMAKEVRIFFSKSNRLVCAHKMGSKIRAIRKKLDEIYDERNPLQLQESYSIESYKWRRTDPELREQNVVGRDEEREYLVRTLLNPDAKKNEVSVIPIVGIGGSGKTTLAQQVYNNVAVKNHFELKMWVCVSDESHALSNNMLAQKIMEQVTTARIHQAGQELRQQIEGKLFLLVLDDVWNIRNRGEWLILENLLKGGKKGSMIIVTTRSSEVAETMRTHDHDQPLSLRDLDEDNSWELFCRIAFGDGKEPDNQELVRIGKDIVRKCSGVPLAIRTIGSLLFTKKLGVTEWAYFRDNELANIDSDKGENKIFSILKLSYDHLPPNLKNCFAFCSLFPKDYKIQRKTLVQMWIAEGFIQPFHNRRLEDVGDEGFERLLSGCLFQDVMLDDLGDIEWCKMHDLIHDLAQSITRNECYIVTSERLQEESLGDGIRHVSSHFNSPLEFPSGNVKTKKVRTILSLKGRWEFIPSHASSRFFGQLYGSKTSLPKYLRVLDLSNQELEIPESIGDLKHLRYLDLSGNHSLEKLPRGITKLYNLLTLRLNKCFNLRELSRDMKRLVRLRHLELDGCDGLTCTPCGLGCLTDLQMMTTFVVDKSSGGGGARITELCDMKLSMGGLEIRGLARQRSNMKEVESSKFLLHMPYLAKLCLDWGTLEKECIRDGVEVKVEDEIILEALEPPPTIKGLYIQGFCGKGLSEWIGRLTTLQLLIIKNCMALASLLESLGRLTSLQRLSIRNCRALASLPESLGSLTSLQRLSIMNCQALASLPKSLGSLTSLLKLELFGCWALAALPESFGSLTSLQELSISNCTALASLPGSLRSLTSLQKLDIFYCRALASLPESFGSLTSLQQLFIMGCKALTSLPESFRSLTSLQELSISNCTALASLPEFLGSLTSLQKLVIFYCRALASLPESFGSLTSLQQLFILGCDALTSLPESLGSLTSLQELNLFECRALAALPKSFGSLTSLQQLSILDCEALASLPESLGNLTSLQKLTLSKCRALTSLPSSIKSLTSLQRLEVDNCSALKERYGPNFDGLDWPGLSNIPYVRIS